MFFILLVVAALLAIVLIAIIVACFGEPESNLSCILFSIGAWLICFGIMVGVAIPTRKYEIENFIIEYDTQNALYEKYINDSNLDGIAKLHLTEQHITLKKEYEVQKFKASKWFNLIIGDPFGKYEESKKGIK